MTTRTGTTRKAPWAVLLTALLAVLALVFGAMAFAGVANAKDNPNKPDNPGNSQSAPGHQVVPPGQQDDGTPGNSDGTPGGGNDNTTQPTKDGKVWVCHADTNNGNGNQNLGHEVNGQGTGGENKTGFNILYISTSAWENGHQGRHPNDRVFASEAAAEAYCGTPTQKYCPDGVTPLPPSGICPSGQTYTCPNDATKTLTHPYTEADAAYCYPPAQTYACPTGTVKAGTPMDHAFDATTAADLAFCSMTPEEAQTVDAAVAAAIPQPATVAAPAPAKVTVPAKGPTVPATVPAGDGSSVPTTPVTALALLVLGATALAASTVRLVGAKR